MTPARNWTDQEMLTIIDLFVAGRSFSEIAKRFGAGRNQIAGIVNRCGYSDADRRNNDRPR